MVNISEQGKEIVKLCELKVTLQNRAEELSCEAFSLLQRLQAISNEQHTLLENMRDMDLKIEYLAQRV